MKFLPRSGFDSSKKRHVASLHKVLIESGMDVRPDEEEVKSRRFGPKTLDLVREFQKKKRVGVTGTLDERTIEKLNAALIQRKYSTKTQVAGLHRLLQKAARIAKVKIALSSDGKAKRIGAQTRAAIRSIQKKYGLPADGKLTPETLERIESVASSRPRPVPALKVRSASELGRVGFPLRLNMSKDRVCDLQKVLAWADLPVSEKEYRAKAFGKSTRDAVLEFQKRRGLPRTGEVDASTAAVLNEIVLRDNPSAGVKERYRIRGSVRDASWTGKKFVKVQVFEKQLRGLVKLSERNTFGNGFFDIVYDPPKDPSTGRPKKNIHLVVRIADGRGREVESREYNVGRVHWVNFTEGGEKFRGISRFERIHEVLSRSLGNVPFDQIEESDVQSDVSHLRADTGIVSDEVMKISLAHRIAAKLDRPGLKPEVFFAFLQQNFPPELPSDLRPDRPGEWGGWIEDLVERTADGIVFLDDEAQDRVLESALKSNIVPRSVGANSTEIAKALKEVRREYALRKPLLVGNGSLGGLLGLSSVPGTLHPHIADVFLKHWCAGKDFWKAVVAGVPGITEAAVRDIQTVVNLGGMTLNHLPTVGALKGKIADRAEVNGVKIAAERDFAKITHKDWVDIIEEHGQGVPQDTPGGTQAEKIGNYARILKGRAESEFPGVALMAELSRVSVPVLRHGPEIAKMLDDFPDFDFRAGNLDKFVKEQTAGGNPPLDPEPLGEAKVIQRVHRIAPSAAAATALLEEKLHSSLQVYACGKDRLVGKLKKKGVDPVEAIRIFHAAEHQYATVLAMIGKYRMQMHRVNPKAMQSYTYTKEELEEYGGVPNLEVLFGSLDYCDCRHCESVYGPAAYLADLLRFLGEKDSLEADKSVQEILFERRPDLANIKLNCENTDTPMPYVDLVCEVLENAVPPAHADLIYQTTLSAEQLRATPEYVREEAYEVLKKASYPIFRSLNLWQEEARAFLDHLGVPRHELMKTFQDRSDANAMHPGDASIAAEYFGLSSQEQGRIVTPAPTAEEQDGYWNVDSTQQTMTVSLFLAKAKFDPPGEFQSLLELLQVRFVNPKSDESKIVRVPKDCDIERMTLDRLGPAKLDRIHRFLRLWRHADWRMWELDLLIRSPKIGNGELDGSCLSNLRLARELQRKLGIDSEQLLAFYDDLNMESRVSVDPPGKEIKSFYDRLFQNPSVTNPVHPDFKAPAPGQNLTEYKATIQSALFVTESDLNRLLGKTDNTFSLGNLSILYRFSTLAKRLGLSVRDFLLLLDVTGISDPFESLAKTEELIRYHEDIVESGKSLVQLKYVLTREPESPAGVRDEVLVQWMKALRDLLSGLHAELFSFNEDHRDHLKKKLAKLPVFSDSSDLTKALDLVEGAWVGQDEDRRSFIERFFGTIVANVEEAKAKLSNATPNEEERIERFEYVLNGLYLSGSANAVREHVSSVTALANERSALLLDALSIPPGGTGLLSILRNEELLKKDDAGNYEKDLSETNFPDMFSAYRLLHKVSVLIDGVDLDIEDLEWFVRNHADVGVPDFRSLPVATGSPAIPFRQWRDWFRLLRFRKEFPEPEETSFRRILAFGADFSHPKSDILKALSRLTTWKEDDLKTVAGKLVLKHQEGALDFAKAETYDRFLKCFRQIRRTGVDAETMFSWADRDSETLEKETARQAREAAKSKYEEKQWLEIVKPIQDELREKKRDGLIGYLLELSRRTQMPVIEIGGEKISNPNYWRKTRDLHSYFLIDAEMSACQMTSRIKQAISSVQLFIQRCFLNLESRYVRIPKEDPDLMNSWSQWKWMKSYRVWEANRKVFLYPENWIEPELRDDKTPFFKELEDEILGNDVTDENVEAAFHAYLKKVEEVARLEICGLFQETDADTDRMHVVGRTKAIPAVYFHRYYDLNYSDWSPWEKVEVEIESEHVMPVVYNRKLHLFWLDINRKPIKVKQNPPVQASSTPTKAAEASHMLEIRLGWTVRTRKGWSPKTLSKQKLIHPWERPAYSYHLRPRYKANDNSLWIDLFLSTSKEFNDAAFYDQYKGAPARMTRVLFNETYRPWHASSFVFDGERVEIRLRGIPAMYYLPGDSTPRPVSSFEYVKENFPEETRSLSRLIPYQRSLSMPAGMHCEFTWLAANTVHSPNSGYLTLLEGRQSKTLLKNAVSPFRAVFSQQDSQLGDVPRPFVYQDPGRAFFVRPEWQELLADCRTRILRRRYLFFPLYHPYVKLFIRELNRTGPEGLFARKLQTAPQTFLPQNPFSFGGYAPVEPSGPHETARKDEVDFSLGGAYSVYNWEIFFHAPLMIACMLGRNQKFPEAMKWFHYIFDPTNTGNEPVPRRFWVTKPFFNHASEDYRRQRIGEILDRIGEFSEEVKAWKNDPFKPHRIARYRPVAYQRTVVMKYIDNLVAWGDQLFRRDTIESINEATLIYILAYELLGDRPVRVPPETRDDRTFRELMDEGGLDIFGNAKMGIAPENLAGLPIRIVPSPEAAEPLPRLETFYFRIPVNDKLLACWNTVEDRLFNIRHCMNIAGIVRQLPLFEPPIDPAILVKAAAAGVDLESVLTDLDAPLPHYRFAMVVQKARQIVGEVRGIGNALLSALEKRDAEEMAVLRADHQTKLLDSARDVRKRQVDEAEEQLNGLNEGRAVVEKRREFYSSREFMNQLEIAAMALEGASISRQSSALTADMLASFLALIPEFVGGGSGAGGSPHFVIAVGGKMLAKFAELSAKSDYGTATMLSKSGGIVSTMGGYMRRGEEWAFQADVAAQELKQIDRQIAAAEIRKAIAEKELENLELQIEQAEEEGEYLSTKYTNTQLYNWMTVQLSTLYFRMYQLAYDSAKRAERCFRYELGLADSSYISFGYWDSLKKGLLAGDKLACDLERLDSAYQDQNRREMELVKRISLAEVSPWNLLRLRLAGECSIDLPEWLFNMDYSGHYLRRIKAVSVSVPCIIGPYTNINCTLLLEKSSIRITNVVGSSGYARTEGSEDARFEDQAVAVRTISTSHGQNDSGMFELRLGDERYLPFEGAGAISTWKIVMPKERNQFDFSTISDFILTLQYTARDGGAILASEAEKDLKKVLPTNGARLLSLRHQFSSEWHRFLNPNPEGAEQEMRFAVRSEHFPFYARGRTIKVSGIDLVLGGAHDGDYVVKLELPGEPEQERTVRKDSALGNAHHAGFDMVSLPVAVGGWKLKIRRDNVPSDDFSSLPKGDLEDVMLLVLFRF